MPRDFKIGMIVGAAALMLVLGWLSTRKNISVQARLEQINEKRMLESIRDNNAVTVSKIAHTISKEKPEPKLKSDPNEPIVQAASFDPDSELVKTELTVEHRKKIKTNKLHVVLKDETLSSISQRYYKSSLQWPRIINANLSVITDPDKIKPGMKLIIPQ